MLRTISIFFLVVLFSILGGFSQAKAEGLVALTSTNVLITFDSATPGSIGGAVAITGLQPGEQMLGLDRRPADGQLYGIGSTSRLYRINPTTGAATQVGSAGAFTLSGTSFGIDFNPVVDRLRVVSNTGQNLRINPNDGTLTATDNPVAFGVGDPNSGTTPRIVAAAYNNNVAGASLTTLYVVDSNLDILATLGGPNGVPSPNSGQLFTTGALGFNTSDLAAFDISGLSGVAYAVFTPPAGFSQLFTINLTTGAATLVGTIGLTEAAIIGLAVPVGATVPEPATMFLLGLGISGLALKIHRQRKAQRKADNTAS